MANLICRRWETGMAQLVWGSFFALSPSVHPKDLTDGNYTFPKDVFSQNLVSAVSGCSYNLNWWNSNLQGTPMELQPDKSKLMTLGWDGEARKSFRGAAEEFFFCQHSGQHNKLQHLPEALWMLLWTGWICHLEEMIFLLPELQLPRWCVVIDISYRTLQGRAVCKMN